MAQEVRKTEEEWQKELTSEQYAVCRKGATERAFTGKYWNSKQDGIYRCAACGNELFSSETKYDSGSGWPSFWEAVDPDRIKTELDLSHGMRRIEVKCARCDSHLGHIFDDGPQPTGQRYCINSIALELDETDNSE